MQFMGYLSDIPTVTLDTKLQAYSLDRKRWESYQMKDLLETARRYHWKDLNQANNYESTWILWALARLGEFAGSDLALVEDLLTVETNRNVKTGAACLGFHSLYAMSVALHRYKALGLPMRGVWLVAERREREYFALVRSLQNADGSFSASGMAAGSHQPGVNERINGNGHAFEWMAFAASPKELGEPWMVNAARSVGRDVTQFQFDNDSIKRWLDRGKAAANVTAFRPRKQERLRKEANELDAQSQGPYGRLGSYYHAQHGLKIYLDRTAQSPAAPAKAAKEVTNE